MGNLRDRINRGVINKDMYTEYLATFEKMSKAEIMAFTQPSGKPLLYLTPAS